MSGGARPAPACGPPADHPSRFSLVPAAYVVLLRGGERTADGAVVGAEVLLQLRRGTGYMDEHWACAAAGHVEAGESVIAAAMRESLEEIGIVLEAADLVPLTAMHRTHPGGPDDQRIDMFFACRRWGGEPRIVEPDKSAGLGWWSLDALPEPVVPHERAVLRALVAGTLAPVTTFGFPGDQGDGVPYPA